MSRATCQGILERDWTRHIIAHRVTPQAIATRALADGKWLAAFAPADTIEALATACATHGWSAFVACTSDDALAGVVHELVPEETAHGECYVILCDDSGPTHAVQIQAGLPVLGRRFLREASNEDVDAFIATARANGNSSATVLLLGHSSRTASLARSLSTHDMRTRALDLGLGAEATAVELLAAASLVGSAVVPFESSRMRETRARRSRALTTWLWAGAGAALIAGFAVARYQTRRTLAHVQAERADISGSVRTAMTARAALDRSTNLTAMLAERERNVSRSSSVLAAIALALPSGATLTALYVAGDSVTIEGESARSAAVYQALRAIPALEQIKLAAPLRQERQAGDVAVEHFSFGARIRRGGKS